MNTLISDTFEVLFRQIFLFLGDFPSFVKTFLNAVQVTHSWLKFR